LSAKRLKKHAVSASY